MARKYSSNESSDDDDRKHRRTHRRDTSDNEKTHRRRDNGHRKDSGRNRENPKEIEGQKTEKSEANPNGESAAFGRTGGVYIPPFRLARMMKEVEDKSSVEYQRLSWDALRKSINGLVNKVNATNIQNIIPELFAENLIRGRGLFCRSCMKSQMASPGFTDVFAALVAVVNTKFPEVGELLLRRIVLQLKRAYKRNDKPQLLAAVKFVAHLVNQQVAHEIIALELLAVLLENPTDDSVEVAVGFVTECGSLLQDMTPKGLEGAFERFRGILHEGEIDKRVQFLIEGLFAIRKARFQGYPAVRPELDLVEQEDQITHEISLQDEIDAEITLDIFKPDPNFLESEKRYEEVKKSILGEESEDEEGSDAPSGDEDGDDDDEDESDEEDEEQMQIKDETETNLVNLRRTIYLTIMSSVDFEEAGHKLLKIKLEPGQEMELCIMLLECCSQERTYLRYYGLLGQRFCMINKVHQENFEKCFVQQYSMIHRLETNKLRNVAKFFAHLLGTDALPWHVLAYIRLTEEDTTSSSRIFIKILFQELSEHLGIRTLNERLSDPAMQDSFESIFPRDNPKNTRFAINFFTSIGLGGITENLREYLKNMPRLIMQQQKAVSESDSEFDSGSGSESESSETSESESSDPESDVSSTDEDERRRKRSRSRRGGSSSDEDERRRKKNRSRKDELSSDEEDKRRSKNRKHESSSDEDERRTSRNRRDDLSYDDDGQRKNNTKREPIADSDDDSRRRSNTRGEPIADADDDRRRKSDRKREPIAESYDDKRRKSDMKREPIADSNDDRRRKSDRKREPIADSDDDRRRKSDRKRESIADSDDDRRRKSDRKREPIADSDDDRRRKSVWKREPIAGSDDDRWKSDRNREPIADKSDRKREPITDEDGRLRRPSTRDEKDERYRRSSRRG